MKPLLLDQPHPCSTFAFLFSLILTIITINNIPKCVSADGNSISQQYLECNKTLSCGGITGLTYPFWGKFGNSERPKSCGEPNLKLECDGGTPNFTVDSVTYRINSWDFETNNLIVSRDDYLIGDICSSDHKNNTLDQSVFEYDEGTITNITLLYNCLSSPTIIQYTPLPGCAGSSPVYLATQVVYVPSCTSVVLPIFQNFSTSISSMYRAALQTGFELNLLPQIYDKCTKCVHSSGSCGYDGKQFTCFCKDGGSSCSSDSGSSSKLSRLSKIGIGASAACFGVVGAIAVVIICTRNRCSILVQRPLALKETETNRNVEEFIIKYGLLVPKRYNYSEVKSITNSFRDQLGRGGYGVVYKGRLRDGRHVAVKVISDSKGSGEDFINEVASISQTSHVNIVSLLGFCSEKNKRALIYEFMSNGSLDKFVHEGESTTRICSLDWNTLYQIVIGIARGLEYLHRGCGTRILHLDIKPQNILLDEDFVPKISDFGLAKICQKKESIVSILGTRGTIGYIAPEVFSRTFGGISHKSDVYSYGMLILEMVGGKKHYQNGGSNTSEMYFPDWIYKDLEQGNILANGSLVSEEENEMIRKITLVSLWCIQSNPSDRPSINKVIEMLEGTLQSLPFPPKPFLYSPARPLLQMPYLSSSNLDETNSTATPKDASIEVNDEAKTERL